MTFPDLSAVGNHLWQSTAFATVAWLLTLLLRKNSARVRHAIWFAASLKFLVPISWLIDLGGRIHWRSVPAAAPAVSLAIDQISQPFSAPVPLPVMSHAVNPLPMILFAIWMAGVLGIAVSWMVRYWRIRGIAQSASLSPLDLPVKVMLSQDTMEPGVFGILHPVLLLPEGIFERLTESQLSAVIEHELCHVRHRDNLIASIQMFVETLFWFHPLVWWIGKRMIAERELGCDEEVLRRGGEPRVYAEGILNVCKLYAESPLVCVAGVTGADLKGRIQAILAGRSPLEMTALRKVVLTAAGLATIATPLLIGLLHALPGDAQSAGAPEKFSVASVRLNTTGMDGCSATNGGGQTYTVRNCPLGVLVMDAYGLNEEQQILGGGSILSEKFDIAAKAELVVDRARMRLMLRSLLEDRFHLVLTSETKEMDVYALTVGKAGRKFPETDAPSDDAPSRGSTATGEPLLKNVSVPDFIQRVLARRVSDRLIVDGTGLPGHYDIPVQWYLDSIKPDGPSIFTAIQEIGLKLEPTKAPVETIRIDRIEHPTEN